MAFSETTLNAQLDGSVTGNSTGRVINIQSYIPGAAGNVDVYVVGVTAPYAGRSRWVQIPTTNTAAQAAALIFAALA